MISIPTTAFPEKFNSAWLFATLVLPTPLNQMVLNRTTIHPALPLNLIQMPYSAM